MRPDCPDDGMRLGEVVAARAIALDQVRHRVETKAVDAQIQPEVEHGQHFANHRRVVVVQVRLMVKEPVPVIRLRDRIPRPVRRLRVDEDDPRPLIALVGIAPHVVVALGRAWRRGPRTLEPGMLIGRVVENQLDHHPHAPLVRSLEECPEVLQRAIARMHVDVIGDVVAIVLERRGKNGSSQIQVTPRRCR